MINNLCKKPQKMEKAPQIVQNDKYYNVKADFSYLAQYGYEITKEIGRGGYGVVYKAVDTATKTKECAIKINFNIISREIIFSEMAYLQLVCGKPHLPKLIDLFMHKDVVHIAIEYFKHRPYITYFNTFNIQEVKHYIWELLSGLKILKELGIYHRDIKPANFLYDPESRKGMIIDFGLAELDPAYMSMLEERAKNMDPNDPEYPSFMERYKTYQRLHQGLKTIGRNKVGTEIYMPIQSLLRVQKQSYSSDIWPVGVILLQFIMRKYTIFQQVRMVKKIPNVSNTYPINYLIQLAIFFGSDALIDQCLKIDHQLKLPIGIQRASFRDLAVLEGFDNVAEDLLQKMLRLEASERITVEQALNHPFFHSIRSQKQN